MEYLFLLSMSLSVFLLVISVKYTQKCSENESLKNQITAYQMTIENMERKNED